MPNTLRNISRYEVRIERAYFRALHELQRLQARRAGQGVPPPIAADIDITISGDPPPSPGKSQKMQNKPNSISLPPPIPQLPSPNS